jgi:quinol monooxygenase YgiN
MIIIAGHWRAKSVIERDAAISAFADLVTRARSADGCIDVAITADSVEDDRVNVLECWRDQQALDAWRKIAKGPRVAVKDAKVQLYRTGDAEKPT